MIARWPRRPKPKDLLGRLSIVPITDYFTIEPEGALPDSAPIDWSDPTYEDVKVAWRNDISEYVRRTLEAQMLPKASYKELVDQARRPEEVLDVVHKHIWDDVNAYYRTAA